MFTLEYDKKNKNFNNRNDAILYAKNEGIREWKLLERVVVSKYTTLNIPILYKIDIQL
jgi:hypothetical protein